MQISIVMPTLNQANFIDASLSSIFDQAISDVEVIVIDGLSTDGTIDILKKWQVKHPEQFKWLSQKDSGPAEAINRGLKLAQGEIIGWLNSDDLYVAQTFTKVIDYFKKNPSKHMVYGEGNHIDEAGRAIDRYPTKKPNTPIEQFLEGCFICQPTVFFRASLLQTIGVLDESLKVAFDFDWWIRFFKLIPENIGFLNDTLASSRLHENCLTQKERRLVALEGMKVLKRHFDHAPVTWVLTYIDELCNAYPSVTDARSLVKIIESFLTDIKPFLLSSELDTLIKQLQSDKRLILSHQNFYIDVSPDGWVSKKTELRLRDLSHIGQTSIQLDLGGGWPHAHTISLTILNSLGESFKASFNSQTSAKLTLKVPKNFNKNSTAWIIETNDFFKPSAFDKNNHDDRELSFMVKSIKLID